MPSSTCLLFYHPFMHSFYCSSMHHNNSSNYFHNLKSTTYWTIYFSNSPYSFFNHYFLSIFSMLLSFCSLIHLWDFCTFQLLLLFTIYSCFSIDPIFNLSSTYIYFLIDSTSSPKHSVFSFHPSLISNDFDVI